MSWSVQQTLRPVFPGQTRSEFCLSAGHLLAATHEASFFVLQAFFFSRQQTCLSLGQRYPDIRSESSHFFAITHVPFPWRQRGRLSCTLQQTLPLRQRNCGSAESSLQFSAATHSLPLMLLQCGGGVGLVPLQQTFRGPHLCGS